MSGDYILDTSQLHLYGDFDEQIAQLLQHVRLTKPEVDRLMYLLDDLEFTLQQGFRGCKVHPFGSIITGLGIKTSDIDCFVSLPYNNNKNEAAVVFKAKHLLSLNKDFTELFAIPKAKVPIVKFFHIPTRTYGDVSFKSPSGVRNSELIGFLLQIDQRALSLAVLIKYWSKVHGFTGTNLMSNYALTLLVIFYLQQVDILPPIFLMQKSVQDNMIDYWNTAFNEGMRFVPNNTQSMYHLMKGFFNYYCDFDFKSFIVSPYLGSPVKKESFQKLDWVPKEFSLYKYIVNERISQPLRLDTVTCVQDPFNHARNCTVAVHQTLFNKILACFKMTAEAFNETPSHNILRKMLTRMVHENVSMRKQTNKGIVRPIKKKNIHKGQQFKKIKHTIHTLYSEYKHKKS